MIARDSDASKKFYRTVIILINGPLAVINVKNQRAKHAQAKPNVKNKILLSGKILRTGFPVQQFHICASRGFFT